MAYTTQSLTDFYWSYKRNTQDALDWLWSICPLDTTVYPYTSFKSTAEILKAAEQVRSQNCVVPGSVISALSKAITMRWRVLEIYQSLPALSDDKDASDHKHKAFIRRLEDVLRILRPLEAKVKPTPSSLPSPLGTAAFEPASNRFAALDDIESLCEAENNAVSRENKGSINMELGTSDRLSQPSSQEILLQDDDIGELIELSYYLYELDTICQQVNIFWREAAERKIPIPLAAFLSTTALHAVSRISTRLEAFMPTYDILVSKWTAHKLKGVKIRFTAIPNLKCQVGGRLADGMSLWHAGQILEHSRTLKEYEKILPDAGKHQDPFSIIQQPTMSSGGLDNAFDADDRALDQMQESMRQLLASKRAIASLEISEKDEQISEPLLPLMKQIHSNTNAPIPIHLVFGMEMLLSTYKAFLWLDGEPNRRKCRIIALQFASEVSKNMLTAVSAINTIGDCGEPAVVKQSLSLQYWAESLKKYAREQRFDLYYQAPWTAGCHIVEILDVAFSHGLYLCCEIGYVCAVLHLYNALRRLNTPVHKILLLEQLCQVLLDPLFLGTLPRDNFSSHFRRAMGQRMKKRSDSNRDISMLSKATATSPRRVLPSTMSVFYELHGSYYRPTSDFWVRIYTNPAIRRPNRTQIRDVTKLVHSEPFNVPLEKIKTRALQEFNSEIPVLRINFFAVFRFCLRLLQDLGETLDQHPDISAQGKGVPLGFAWANHILDSIVEHLRDDSKRKIMRYWRELNVTKTVFTNVDGAISVSDYVICIICGCAVTSLEASRRRTVPLSFQAIRVGIG